MFNILDFSLSGDDRQSQVYEEFAESKALEFKNFLAGGDFPIPEKLMQAIRVELGGPEPSVAKLVELISSDPLLSMRLVSLVNYPAYARVKGTATVKGAIQQLGFMKLVDACGELSKSQDFTKNFSSKLLPSDCYQRLLSISVLAQKLVQTLDAAKDRRDETIVGCAAQSLPRLLLAYYRPAMFSVCAVDANWSSCDFDKSFKKLFNASELETAESLVSSMSMPKGYSRLLSNLAVPVWNKRSWTSEERQDLQAILSAVYVSSEIINELYKYNAKDAFENRVKEIAKKLSLNPNDLLSFVTAIPYEVSVLQDRLGLTALAYPSYLAELANQPTEKPVAARRPLSLCLSEIRTDIDKINRNPVLGDMQQAVYKTLLSMVKVLGFDRAVFLMHDELSSRLHTLMSFGRQHEKLSAFARVTSTQNYKFKPDLEALHMRKIVFQGDPLFGDDWPFVAFPVVKNGKSIGVFYADLASKESASALSMEEQLSLTALAELWHDLK